MFNEHLHRLRGSGVAPHLNSDAVGRTFGVPAAAGGKGKGSGANCGGSGRPVSRHTAAKWWRSAALSAVSRWTKPVKCRKQM